MQRSSGSWPVIAVLVCRGTDIETQTSFLEPNWGKPPLMSTAILLALHLVAQQTQIEVSTPHDILEMEGKPYFLLEKGKRLEANVSRESADGQIWIDVARVGLGTDNRAGLGRMSVVMGAQTRTVRVRAPLVAELGVGTDRIASKIKSTSLVVMEAKTQLSLEASAEDSDLLVSIEFGGMTRDDTPLYRVPSLGGAAQVAAVASPGDAAAAATSASSSAGADANAPRIESVQALRLGAGSNALKIVVKGEDASGNVVALVARFLDANGEVVTETKTAAAPPPAPADAAVATSAPETNPVAATPSTAPAAGPDAGEKAEAPAAAAESPASTTPEATTSSEATTSPEAAPSPETVKSASESGVGQVLAESDRYFLDSPVHGQTRFVAERTFPQIFARLGEQVVQVEVMLEDDSGRRSAAQRATIELFVAPVADATAVAAAGATSFLQQTLGLPIGLSAQVSAGGVLQVSGGLQPLVLQGGLRVGARYREGDWQRYGLAFAVDALQQAASTPATYRPAIRWSSGETRLRLEGSVDVGRYEISGFDVGATVLAGFGVTVGNHYVVAGGKTSQFSLFGPTARVGIMADTRLGPGALTLALPLDVAVDMAGGVSGYGPIALGLTAGYRFDF